jgi:hypothetical protein
MFSDRIYEIDMLEIDSQWRRGGCNFNSPLSLKVSQLKESVIDSVLAASESTYDPT